MNRQISSQSLRILGALLAYPDEALQAAMPEMAALLIAEGWLPKAEADKVLAFMQELSARDIYDAQEEYVALFDRTPSLSLHLFEHVHGDSRDRGQALVDLDQLYRECGLENASEHTPDYLPMFLEYLSLLPVKDVRASLDGVLEIVAALRERLHKRESGYAAVLAAIEALATRKPDAEKLKAAMAQDAGAALDNEMLDAAWAEQFALAAPTASDSCPKAEQMLARMTQDYPAQGGRP